MRIGILEPKNFSKSAINELSELGDLSVFKDNIDDFLKDIDVLFIRLGYFIGEDILNKAPRLKIICSPTTGLNHIDLNETKKRNIKIISLKNEREFLSTIRATPEHTFGLVLALLRNYKNSFLNSQNTEWNRDKYTGNEIYGNKTGIIGLGRVGKILAKYFNCFGAEVFYYDIDSKIQTDLNIIQTNSIEELINKTEILILSASYSDKVIINRNHFNLMKNKYFINTARGELIDESYLIEKINNNFFKGVAIDVITNETGDNNLSNLLKVADNKNVIVTSHISGATFTSMNRTEEFIVGKLESELKNRKI
ncbi:MAG: hypothetical protein K8R54_06710 [Bacteroidales bacterium]|nr:hypothetical protein [Bacteroidales bacterium]